MSETYSVRHADIAGEIVVLDWTPDDESWEAFVERAHELLGEALGVMRRQYDALLTEREPYARHVEAAINSAPAIHPRTAAILQTWVAYLRGAQSLGQFFDVVTGNEYERGFLVHCGVSEDAYSDLLEGFPSDSDLIALAPDNPEWVLVQSLMSAAIDWEWGEDNLSSVSQAIDRFIWRGSA